MKNTLYGALLSAFPSGAFWLLFLFFVCFFGIHIVRLAKIGWQYRKGAPNPAPKAEEKPRPAPQPQAQAPQTPQAPPEPVYYIVERKRKRPRETYSTPREIRFK